MRFSRKKGVGKKAKYAGRGVKKINSPFLIHSLYGRYFPFVYVFGIYLLSYPFAEEHSVILDKT